jgi:ribonuclease HI
MLIQPQRVERRDVAGMNSTVHLMMSQTEYGWRWNLLTPVGGGNGIADTVEQALYDALQRFWASLGGCRRVEVDQAVPSQARTLVKQTFGIDVVRAGFSVDLGGPLVVATDGSAKGTALGWGWAAGNGQTGSGGGALVRRIEGADAPLVAELRGIEAAIRAIPGRRLHLLVDSRGARAWVQRWLDGSQATPCPGVADLKELVYSQRRRLEIEWVRGHNGHSLNEAADRLARKARARACSRGMALAA